MLCMKGVKMSPIKIDDYSDILSVKEVQTILRIGRDAAYSLVSSNKIKSLRIGNQYRIPKQFLFDYINEICYNKEDDGGSDEEVLH